MKSDFEHWLAAQFADTGPFTIFILLVRIAGHEVKAVTSSYAHLIGDEMTWPEMRAPCDREKSTPVVVAVARLPFLTADGTLSIPFDSPGRYHWWRGGQSVKATLQEVTERRNHAGDF